MDQELNLPSALPEDYHNTSASGLTDEEVVTLKAAGQGNALRDDGSKSTWEILKSNLFTWFNLLNVILALCLLAVGSYRNMTFIIIDEL